MKIIIEPRKAGWDHYWHCLGFTNEGNLAGMLSILPIKNRLVVIKVKGL